jgi:FkbM family methyltransferase
MFTAATHFKDYILSAFALGRNPKERGMIFWKQTKNIRVMLRLSRHEPENIYSLRTIYGPLFFRDNFGDITNLKKLFYHREYRFTKLQDDGVILDIGANIGLAAAWFSYHNPEKTIYCFEPLAANALLIKLNCPDAKVEQVALGARSSRVKLGVDPDSVMASQIPCKWSTQEMEFNVISLDDFARSREVKRVALMKIDVEGMEEQVLQGGKETLKKTYRVVLETHGQSLHDMAIGFLRQADFHVDSEVFFNTTGLLFATNEQMTSAASRFK